MKLLLFFVLSLFLFTSCQKEKVTMGLNVSENFYLENKGASMRVLVEGNTRSKTFLVFVHGFGANALFYNTDYISNHIEDKYACVYWDQRNAGASQGNSNGSHFNLNQFTDDLKKLIAVLKYRYGQNINIFILGHSFGGLITSSFMTTDNNQSLVKGWIFTNGSHNFPLNDSLTRLMLLDYGQQQIALDKNVDKWTPIIEYCNQLSGNLTLEQSDQLLTFAADAETYFDEVKKIDFEELFIDYARNYNMPVTSTLINMRYWLNADLSNNLLNIEFSSMLHSVTTPTLVLSGKYDFSCPSGLGDDLYEAIGTNKKKNVTSSISGHYIWLQDESFFCKEINEFIEKYK